MVSKIFHLHAQNDAIPKKYYAVQGDTNRGLEIYVDDIDQSEIVTAKIYATKPDGHEVWNNCTVSTVDEMKRIIAPITSETLAVPGVVKANIQLFNSNTVGTAALISTYEFEINVQKSNFSSSAAESSDEYGVLLDTIAEAEEKIQEADEKIQEMTELMRNVVLKTDIADNLTTDSSTKVLSAKQGKILNTHITDIDDQINQSTEDITVAYTKSVTDDVISVGIKKLGGKTVVENQLVQNGNFASTSGWFSIGGSTINYGNNEATINKSSAYSGISNSASNSFNIISGHKYYISVVAKSSTDISTFMHGISDASSQNTVRHAFSLTSTFNKCSFIGTAPANVTEGRYMAFDTSNTTLVLTLKNVQVIDLTQMFGAGNEPSTVAEVEAIIGTDYIPYNTGSLESAEVESVDTFKADTTPLGSFPIPQEIQNLDGYGWSAGNVYNEVDFVNKKFIKRVGSVDLGSLNWAYYDNASFKGFVSNTSPSGISDNNIILMKQYTKFPNYTFTIANDKCYTAIYNTRLIIRDDSFSGDIPAFKSAMSGVILYYELATPVETDISAYIDGTTIEVENGGTITFTQDGLHIPVPSTVEYLSLSGSVRSNTESIASLRDGKMDKSSIVDNLTTNDSTKVLSAKQGKVLNDNKLNKTDVLNTLTSSDSTKALSAKQGKELNTHIAQIDDQINKDVIDSSVAYIKDVDADALPVAMMTKLGGRTIVGNQLVPNNLKSFTSTTVDTRSSFYLYIRESASPYTVLKYEYIPLNYVGKKEYIKTSTFSSAISILHNGASVNIPICSPCNVIDGHKYFISIDILGADVQTVGGLQTDNLNIVDLTQMGIDTWTDDEIKAFLSEYRPYNEGSLESAEVSKIVSYKANTTVLAEAPIPQEIQNLDGYGWSAGNVYNEVDFENKKFIKRVGSVDLGTLNWGYYSNLFLADDASFKLSGNILTPLYPTVSTYSQIVDTDKAIWCHNTSRRMVIHDSSYTDASAFKTAMNGVMLYYELDTPIETDISAYIDGRTIEVENGGTITFTQDGLHIPVPSTVVYPGIDTLSNNNAKGINNLNNKINVLYDRIEGLGNRYGAYRPYGASSCTLTRIWDSVGKSAAVQAGSTTVTNDFDFIEPFSLIKTCNIKVIDGEIVVTAYKGDADFKTDGSNGHVAVEIPEHYYCPSDLYDGYETFGVSMHPQPGWVKAKKRYIGAYNCADDSGTKLKSISGVKPLVSTSLTNLRTKATATDNICQIIDMEDWYILTNLFCVEFATTHTQSIMNGASSMSYDAADTTISAITDSTHITVNNGNVFVAGQSVSIGSAQNGEQRTSWVEIDSVNNSTGEIVLKNAVSNMAVGDFLSTRTWITGETDNILHSGYNYNDSKHPMKYRGIENMYGNIYQWVDGALINDNQAYVCKDKAKFSSTITSDYTALSYVNWNANGYPLTLGNDKRFPFARFPDALGGSTSTGYADFYYQATGLRGLYFGGYWNIGSSDGAFFLGCNRAPSNTSVDIGSRLSWKAA